MKKSSLSITAVLFTMTVLFANSSEAPSFISLIESKAISVSLKGFSENPSTVKLFDAQGVELVNKKPSKKLSNYIFKLDELPDGNYFIEAEDKYKIVKQLVIISESKIYVDQVAKASFKPAVTITGKKARVNMLALGEEVTISFSDPIGNTLFEEKISNVPNVNKVYDFMHLPVGTYFLNIKVGESSFGYVVYR
jgi:hypothetical protein